MHTAREAVRVLVAGAVRARRRDSAIGGAICSPCHERRGSRVEENLLTAYSTDG